MAYRRMVRFGIIVFLVFSLGLALYPPQSAYSQKNETAAPVPERWISMAVEYPGVQIARDEDDVSMDLIFHNKGKSDESVRVWIESQPPDWKARIKTYRFTVTGIHVPSGSDKTLTFDAKPPKNVQPGKYDFMIKAQTSDKRFDMSQKLTVEILEKASSSEKSSDLELTTSYPVIRGPSDASFKFSVEVDSKLESESVLDLFAQGPEGWEVNFKPAYEEKYISSLRLKARENKSIDVEIKPAMAAQAGEYPINIRVSSGKAEAKATLTVILTGTYKLEVGTSTGLLSLEARQGKPANLSFYIRNTGSAPINEISFMSFKPENWQVEFKPEKIDTVAPDELQQVEMIITPYEDALVGDYSVGVTVKGEKVSENMELRTTVKASAVWGWIGIGLIVVVIAGLLGLFRFVGRR